ncbi:transcription factor E2F3 [Mugil cephalus]|uniref:transcription factor E2F3 n=1 Tax=Mugil cephalus TaxID=48193 RepID=UPI001FB83EAD|nr:transcription factor E2F3 [Mugil cephalus]
MDSKKPMASLTPTTGNAPGSKPITSKSYLDRPRCDNSLVNLTQKFLELLKRSIDGVLDLNVVTQELGISKRRVYDVTNVLEGIQLIKKTSKNHIQWMGGGVIGKSDQELKVLAEKEEKLDELIRSCMAQMHRLCEDHHSQRYAYLTYEDVHRIPSLKEQTVIVIKAPVETKLEVPHPEESLQVRLSSTQGPIEVFLCSDDPMPMEAADSLAATSWNYSIVSWPFSSVIQVSPKGNASDSCGITSFSNPLSVLTQQSVPVAFSPMPTLPQSPTEDRHSFVTLTPPLACSLDEEQYLLSLPEDEGITDLFSCVDLDQSQDMPLL